MVRTRILFVVGLLVVAGLPASRPAPPVTVPPESAPPPGASSPAPWAVEAVEWFEAWDEAARLGIPNLLRFVAPDVVHEDFVVGRADYGSHRQREHNGYSDTTPTASVYLDVDGALVERRERGQSFGDLRAVEFDRGMITREDELGVVWPADPGDLDVLALADAYLRTWSSSDPGAIEALYSPGAELTDSLLRLEVSGADAIVHDARGSRSSRLSFRGRDPDPMGGEQPSAFVRWVAGPEGLGQDAEVFIRYIADDGSGCPGDEAVALRVSGSLIVSERRYHEIESVRRCWDAERLSSGWWSGLEPPAPYEDVVTGTVRVGAQRVEIHNGAAALERLVLWAMGRFEIAGLPAPSVASITFDEDTTAPQCAADRRGLSVDLGESAQVFVCTGEERACEDEACTAFVANARLVVLHELAHAWMFRDVDETTQRAFMEHMGVAAWSSADVIWYDRGVEQAAQVLAWGLMDESIRPGRLGDRPCEQLVESFRILTGKQPPQDACAAPD
jgi:hypothetical protein